MNEFEEKLIMILYECNKHKQMINFSYNKLEKYLPLNVDLYSEFDNEMIGFIDQFVFRFSKLQDTMGEKLFSTMILLLGEDFSKKPFIDLLNRLEKMDLLYKDEWMDLRKIRNEVAHEYSFNQQELVHSLNNLFSIKDKLLNIYETFYNYCYDKFDFVRESEILNAKI